MHVLLAMWGYSDDTGGYKVLLKGTEEECKLVFAKTAAITGLSEKPEWSDLLIMTEEQFTQFEAEVAEMEKEISNV